MGLIWQRIDIRSMKSIIEWKAAPSCTAQFSFDENSIYAVDNNGQVDTKMHMQVHETQFILHSYLSGPFTNQELASLVVHLKVFHLQLLIQANQNRRLHPLNP